MTAGRTLGPGATRAARLLRAVAGALAVALAIAPSGCGSSTRTTVLSTTAPAEYPCVLRDPRTMGHDFLVRQSLAIHARRGDQPVDGQFDAVLQKQGDTLLIVGFGPMNVKAFTLSQREGRIEFTQFAGPELPFSPRNILADVHRVFFKRLPPPADGYSGAVHGELDGEAVEETWQDGQLRATVFTRPGSALRGAIRVELGPGCAPARCQPGSATLRNEWFGYTVTITNEDFEEL